MNLLLILYVGVIVCANFVTAELPPMHLFSFIVPAGTLFIGTTFFLRDVIQWYHGRLTAYKAIAIALIASAIASVLLGDLIWITVASAISFAVSETVDAELFTRMRKTIQQRVLWSGLFGGFLDSGIFVIIGLSPLTTNIVPWAFIPEAILGQIIVKSIFQFIAASISRKVLQSV